jgi:hypothetical protein
MPDDFLHRVQLLAIAFRGFCDDLTDAAAHLRDQDIRDAFKDRLRFSEEAMARHLTKEWGQSVKCGWSAYSEPGQRTRPARHFGCRFPD